MANLKYKNKNDEWKSILSTRGPKGDNADITVNGSNLKEASFYAPISSGLIGQALVSKGANKSPQWTNLAAVAGTNSYNDLDNKPTIPTTTEELISGSTSVLTSGGAYNAFAQRGIPSGGSAGQVIKKASATDYDFSWADACIDNLTSTSIITPLSANQGRILNEKFNNYLPLHGTADKAATVGNLVIRGKSMSWGALTASNGYTVVNAWDSPADGGIALSDKDNHLSVQIDGLFYQNEGRYRCLDTSDLGNYAFYKWPSGTIALSDSGTRSISKELTITTKGRPVYISVSGDNNPTTESCWFSIYFYRDGTIISNQIVESHGKSWNIPFSMQYLDIVSAGTHTYKVEFSIGSGSTDLNESGTVQSPNFTVFEI